MSDRLDEMFVRFADQHTNETIGYLAGKYPGKDLDMVAVLATSMTLQAIAHAQHIAIADLREQVELHRLHVIVMNQAMGNMAERLEQLEASR